MNIRLTVAAATATVLASIALYPLINGGAWFWAGVGAVIVVAAIGALTRRRAIPAIACFAAAIAGELAYLNVVFAHRESWAGLVPTGASVHYLRLLVAQASSETTSSPPVLEKPGIVLVTAAGIGLVAALTDLLAVRLHRPAIAGLPLLVLFCVPLTTAAQPGAVGGALVFCAGVVGYLGLLSADGRHRLRLWGRLVHPWHDDDTEGPDVRPLTAAGRRIGTAAVVLALSLPLLVPGLREHQLFPSTGGTGTGGYHGQISLPRPLDTLNQELRKSRPQIVLQYHSTEALPPYLQVYVLNHLTARAWTLTAPGNPVALKNGIMPAPPGLGPGTDSIPFREEIRLSANLNSSSVSYLPLPFVAHQVLVSGTWNVDPGSLTVLATNARLAGLFYTVTGKDLNPSPLQLRDAAAPSEAVAEQDEYVPPLLRNLRGLAHHVIGRRTTEYGKLVALQKWFTNGRFHYSISNVSASNSPDALKTFLTKTRTGYCQQFAFGMAVLARLLHIPSQVVIGYTQGSSVGDGNWQVKTSDAHAWPEFYFAGVGWVRFEPTPPDPGGEAGQATAISPPYSNPQAFTGTGSTSTAGVTAQKGTDPEARTGHTSKKDLLGKLKNLSPRGDAGAAGRKKSAPPFEVLAIVLLAVILIGPGLTRVVTRRWRWWKAGDDVARAHVAWRELRDDLTDYRIPVRASESPRALAGRLAQSLHLAGPEREALERIARAEERATYASSPDGSAQLRSDAALVRQAVAHASGLRTRWTARIAPRSALVPVRAGLQHLLDGFSWIELATTKLLHRTLLRRDKPAHT